MAFVTVMTITVGIQSKGSVFSIAKKFLSLRVSQYQMKNVNVSKDSCGVFSSNNVYVHHILLYLVQVVYVIKIISWLMENVLLTVRVLLKLLVMNQVDSNVNVNQDIISLNFKLEKLDVNLIVQFLKIPFL